MPTRSAPRVLTITFEFVVPEGLAGDVRFSHVESAVDSMSAAVQALAPSVFPRANRIDVTQDWSYRWMRRTKRVDLQPTDKNTPN
jgi:hypothetical protein